MDAEPAEMKAYLDKVGCLDQTWWMLSQSYACTNPSSTPSYKKQTKPKQNKSNSSKSLQINSKTNLTYFTALSYLECTLFD